MIKTALLLNGLLMYQPAAITPLADLGRTLEAAGWSVCIDNHFHTNCKGQFSVIIGHSQGGASALSLAYKYRPQYVVTFDAVRMKPCPSGVKCLNFKTPGYPSVPGATNVPVQSTHVGMVLVAELQSRTLSFIRPVADVVEPKLKSKPIQPTILQPCESDACRLFCPWSNTMRPGWCNYYRDPVDPLEFSFEELCSMIINKPEGCPND